MKSNCGGGAGREELEVLNTFLNLDKQVLLEGFD